VSPRRSPGDGTVFKRKSDNLWVAGFTIDGQQYRATAKLRNDAIAKRKEMRQQLEAGIQLGAGKAKLSAYLDRWLINHKPKVDPETFRSYSTTVRLYINPHVGNKRLDKLTPDDVRDMITELQKTSPRNAQKAYTILRLALKAAVDERKLSWNVAQVVGMPKHTPTRHPAFTAAEALHIMATADSHCDETWAARWRTGILTGKRECEVLGLEWDRVDFDEGMLDISWQLQELKKTHGCGEPKSNQSQTGLALDFPCGKQRVSFCPQAHWDFQPGFEYRECERSLVWTRPKTKKTEDQPIPLEEPLRGILRQLRDHDGHNPHNLVFHHPDGSAISQSQDQKAWRRLLITAGVEHQRQHTLRQTAATLMRAAMVDEATRMELLGHTSTDVHRLYAGPQAEQHRAAMGKLADMLAPKELD
jgi:integrase